MDNVQRMRKLGALKPEQNVLNPFPQGINAEEITGSMYELEVMDVSMESVIQRPQDWCPYEPTETVMSHAQDLYKSKPDKSSIPVNGCGHKVPPIGKEANYNWYLLGKGKSLFPNQVSLGTTIPLQLELNNSTLRYIYVKSENITTERLYKIVHNNIIHKRKGN